MNSRRFVFVLVLVVLVAAAIAAGRAATPRAPVPAGSAIAPDAADRAESSTVWFCPGLPTTLPRAAGRVTFANIGSAAAEIVVTDLADNGTVTRVTFDVASGSVVTRARVALGGPGSLTVETFGGRVLVEEGIEAPQAIDSVACATQTSPHWYFAAGSTPRGEQQWVVIDNPYASDAKVNVTLRTSNGVLKPDALQSLDVARRSRVLIAVHDYAVRTSRVAVAVDSVAGSVVAAQTLVFTRDAGTPGVALSIGAPVAMTDWTFAGGVVEPSSTSLVAIANVGDDAAQVDVQATAESPKTVFPPTSVNVPQDAIVWVLLGHCATAAGQPCVNLPDGARYGLDVRSEQNVSIVAQTLGRFDAPGIVGTVTSPGEVAAARSWAFARMRVGGVRSTTLEFFNPGAAPAVVRIGLVFGGRVARPSSFQHVVVPPGRGTSVVVVGGTKPGKTDAAITVDATEPVFVERTIVAAQEAATSIGVIVG